MVGQKIFGNKIAQEMLLLDQKPIQVEVSISLMPLNGGSPSGLLKILSQNISKKCSFIIRFQEIGTRIRLKTELHNLISLGSCFTSSVRMEFCYSCHNYLHINILVLLDKTPLKCLRMPENSFCFPL